MGHGNVRRRGLQRFRQALRCVARVPRLMRVVQARNPAQADLHGQLMYLSLLHYLYDARKAKRLGMQCLLPLFAILSIE